MNTTLRNFLVITCVSVGLCPPVGAVERVYVGVKTSMDSRIESDQYTPAKTLGVMAGGMLSGNRDLSIYFEAEVNAAVSAGNTPTGGSWGIKNAGFYGAFRAGRDSYVKAKAGYANLEIQDTSLIAASDLSFGIGFGMPAGKKRFLEFEYTYVNSSAAAIVRQLSIAYLF